MKTMRGPVHVLACAFIAVTLAGCSSGGSRGPVSAGSRAASDQVAAAIFIQQWGQILFGLTTPFVSSPDGTTFTGADGTVAVLTFSPDGSARLEITYPDGRTQTLSQSVPTFDGVSKTTIDWQIESSDGLSVTYTSVIDDQGTIFDASDDTIELQGSSVLPTGETQQFTAITATGQTTLQSQQSDGSSFSLQAPLAPPLLQLPDFSQPTTGTYSSPDCSIQFTLSSTAAAPSRWASLVSDFGGGLTGEFSLNPDFSGSGRLLQDGEVVALLSWTRTGDTQVSFLSAESGATSAAGAAVDYLRHRWQTLAALSAPAPGP